MDEIEKRLREATDACISTYDAWRKDQKEIDVRENLMEAVHELRKIGARLEIEIAISERDQMAARPIPIPPHRASQRRGGHNNNFDADDNIGNAADNVGNHEGANQQQHQPRSSGGPRRGGGGGSRRHGGGGGGGHRQGGGGRQEG